jgi:uncharacterized protein YigE (DUF2233 family)
MKSTVCKWLFALCFTWLTLPALAGAPTTWQRLADGLEYTQLKGFPAFPEGKLHAFRMDLSRYQLRVMPLAPDNTDDAFHQLMKQQHAVLAVNGSFFATNGTGLKPLGLRIDQGTLTTPLRNISWWSVFYIQDQQAKLVTNNQFPADQKPEFAIQAGPRLIADGQVIPTLKPGTDLRTALCIQKSGKVIVLATQDVLLSTADLANVLQRSEQRGGLDCQQALNLDGGHSTQLYAHTGDFSLTVPSYSQVADAVLVVPR